MADYKKIEEKRVQEWMIKSDKGLKEKIDELRRIRFANQLDNTKLIPYNDILHAAFRFPPLLDILKKAQIKPKEDKC